MKVYSRKRWGARKLTSPATLDGVKHDLVVHHSAGFGMPYDTFSEQAAIMRQIERQHLGQGWVDIGYNFVIFQPFGTLKRGRIFEGRGWGRLPAAQANHNSGTIAVCVIGNFENQKPKLGTLWRLVAIGREASRRGLRNLRGHRDYLPTACPGRNLYSKLPWIRKRTGLK